MSTTRLLLALLASTVGLVGAERTTVTSRIDAVTVYPERAEVIRTAELTLEAGRNEIIIEGLPVEIDGDSVRCRVIDDDTIRVVHLHSERYQPERDLRQEIAELDAEHEQGEEKIRAYEDSLVALRRRDELVNRFRAQTLQRIQNDLQVADPPVDTWQQALAFLADEASAGRAAVRKNEVGMFEIKRALADNRQQARLLSAGDNRPQARRVQCWLEAPQAASVTLQLRYQVTVGVQWGMHYDLRLNRAENTIELAAMVAVSQETEEDWRGATLTFSTRRPSRGLDGPDLPSLHLHAVAHDGTPEATAVLLPANPSPAAGAANPAAAADQEPITHNVPVDRPQAVAASRKRSEPGELEIRPIDHLTDEIWYHASEPVDVAADGHPVLVTLGTWTTDATWHRRCLPEVLPAVFFHATFDNPTSTRLLPGPAQGFLDGRSIGHIEFSGAPAEGQAQCAFGIDPDIAVHRRLEPIEQIDHQAGEHSSQSWRYTTLVDLHHRGEKPATVRIIEAVPISTMERVAITVGENSSEGERDASSITWQRTLEPGERETLSLVYQIRIDADDSGR